LLELSGSAATRPGNAFSQLLDYAQQRASALAPDQCEKLEWQSVVQNALWKFSTGFELHSAAWISAAMA
jgi:hypothetical protein